eukprot:GHVS01094638.1.p1 GENE.GHVS01094638.1~~GHVS01094638.1.p1  ORF type:complete len:331 (+),score=71.06 GHVS01094638.1:504-1496(+)
MSSWRMMTRSGTRRKWMRTGRRTRERTVVSQCFVCCVSGGDVKVWSVCLRCYAAGRYPAILNDKQFLKVDLPVMGGEGEGTGEWAYEECEKLIDGIEMFKEDWEAVARHVGTDKTPAQCVAYFVQMPIKEPYEDEDGEIVQEEDEGQSPSEGDGKRRKVEKGGGLPFCEGANPLLTQLAFLASVVNPDVATAAAKAALDAAVAAGTNEPGPPQDEGGESGGQTGSCGGGRWSGGDGYVSDRDMEVVCGTALAAAAIRARQLATAEEQEIKKLMPEVLGLQLKRVKLKVDLFRAMEAAVKAQKQALEASFESLVKEHRNIQDQFRELPSNL